MRFGNAITGDHHHWRSFIEAASAMDRNRGFEPARSGAYPVAVGVVTAIACKDLSTKSALAAYYQASVSQQLQAALRLMALGQQAAVALQQRFESVILECAELASRSPLDALGTSALIWMSQPCSTQPEFKDFQIMNGPLRVDIGGPVGSGKTTLTEKLCKAMRDTYSLGS